MWILFEKKKNCDRKCLILRTLMSVEIVPAKTVSIKKCCFAEWSQWNDVHSKSFESKTIEKGVVILRVDSSHTSYV